MSNDARNIQLAMYSAFFARLGEAEDSCAVAPDAWARFCAAAKGAGALENAAPPAYEDYRHFFNCILTPGYPGALVPVESLYKSRQGSGAVSDGALGCYLSDSARHMRAVCANLGVEIPDEFAAVPDHLVLLLELNEFLRDHAPAQDARSFARSHFDWLEHYRKALGARLRNEDDAALVRMGAFYDALLGSLERFVFEEGGTIPVGEAGNGENRRRKENVEGVLVYG